ncbi:tRNA (guanosine(46)-N(7))-methyltransferase TrmB [Herbaspirillum sp. YR522]|uniref:tRNA (guanine(46)-N(7))-methyltransferase TrmB n=1 Tax=Herbaspirillum sp. YR522 TaxID=1144342 RepID=UPI00026FBC77|nr:methyltransferase domain-containing protein [Herbaspirillum sp. YR522]EJN00297.1 putative S-adenosylmethionine-dependent methyltransferase [Herbaspirillum sp. YR522]
MNSTPISSAQNGVHDALTELVARHVAHPFQKPITDYNRRSFDASMAAWQAAGCAPLILDTGCGVGLSTLHLATRHPDHFVIGIDQSADRLARQTQWSGEPPRNLCFVRADLVDYWRLALQAGVRPAQQYLLYPNPWPKIGQLARRWHGHAVFPTIVALGGRIECRSNWRIYIEEFAQALQQVSARAVAAEQFVTDAPITPFERKYLASGHALWRCRLDLGVAP